jgi:quercetin dioxygenase-like cupin family protein
MEPITTVPPVVLTSDAIRALPVEPLGNLQGVTHRVLWRDGASMAGVMTIDAGRHLGDHAHRENHHHMWILEGRATILGTELGPGGYVHIPSGVEHDIDATATEGCTFFYLYLRVAE